MRNSDWKQGFIICWCLLLMIDSVITLIVKSKVARIPIKHTCALLFLYTCIYMSVATCHTNPKENVSILTNPHLSHAPHPSTRTHSFIRLLHFSSLCLQSLPFFSRGHCHVGVRCLGFVLNFTEFPSSLNFDIKWLHGDTLKQFVIFF